MEVKQGKKTFLSSEATEKSDLGESNLLHMEISLGEKSACIRINNGK